MTDYDSLIRQLGKLATEQVNPDTVDIDRLTPLEIARRINSEDKKVATIVESALEPLARAGQIFADTLRTGGRVFYVGAGTSGRLGVLDAAECPPTFGTDPGQIVGVISGGYETLVLSREGVEDDVDAAVANLKSYSLSSHDFVIGLAASTRTPYTNSALQYARSAGAKTAFIICNNANSTTAAVDVLIELPVGPEAVAGSTRMKSGTAQKMALNIISTTAMVLLGKTYGNLMVDLQARSEKLRARSRMILMNMLEVDLDKADELLQGSDGSVKIAMVMYKLGCHKDEAIRRLGEVDGRLYRLIE